MKVTPVDIAHKKFNKSFMGFNQDEVSQFLSEVSHQLEELIKERSQLKDLVREKDLALIEYKERDQILKTTITNASQMVERMREDSEKQVQLMIGEARLKANEIERDAHQNLKNIYNEINRLKKLRLQYEANMKAMAHAHLSLLEEGQKHLGFPTLNSSEEASLNELAEESNFNNVVTGISPLSVDMI